MLWLSELARCLITFYSTFWWNPTSASFPPRCVPPASQEEPALVIFQMSSSTLYLSAHVTETCLSLWLHALFLLKVLPLLPVFSSSGSQCGPLTSSIHSLALSQTYWTKLWPGAQWSCWTSPPTEAPTCQWIPPFKELHHSPGFLPYSHDWQLPPSAWSVFLLYLLLTRLIFKISTFFLLRNYTFGWILALPSNYRAT